MPVLNMHTDIMETITGYSKERKKKTFTLKNLQTKIISCTLAKGKNLKQYNKSWELLTVRFYSSDCVRILTGSVELGE